MQLIHFTRRQTIVLSTAIAIFLLTVLFAEGYILRHTDHVLTLPGDHSFLNLAVAKNLAFNQVWGISKDEFAAKSSSLLFPALLAIPFFIFGAHIWLVLVINLLMAILLLILLQQWLVRLTIPPSYQLLILLAVTILTPLSLIVVAGREGILQLLLGLLFLTQLYKNKDGQGLSRSIYLYGALLVATQYTGILVIAPACWLLLRARRVREAGQLLLSSLLPVLGFGVLSLTKHNPFIPKTLFMPPLDLLNFGWLIGLLIAIVCPLVVGQDNPQGSGPALRPGVKLIGLIIVGLILTGDILTLQETGRISIDTYRQQWIAGRFARRYYNKTPLAVGDIGVISYLTDGRLLDLSATSPRQQPDTLLRLIQKKNIRIAFFSNPYDKELPAGWNRVASWQIPAAHRGADRDLIFCAADTFEASRLRQNLVEYQFNLPQTVAVKYY